MTLTEQTSDYRPAIERASAAGSVLSVQCPGTPYFCIKGDGGAMLNADLVTDVAVSGNVDRHGWVDSQVQPHETRSVSLKLLERWLEAVAHCNRIEQAMHIARPTSTPPKVAVSSYGQGSTLADLRK